jgi:hypothetical protein
MTAMDMDPADPSHRRVFHRDLAALQASGWLISSDAERNAGIEATYQLRVVDHRLPATFNEQERAELLRAARSAGLGQLYEDLDPRLADGHPASVDPSLDLAQRAIATRCLLHFWYGERERLVHPYDLAWKPAGWLLRGREDDTDLIKHFYLSRAVHLDIDRPGTAEAAPGTLPSIRLDPMCRRDHEPIEVTVTTTGAALADVVSALGANGHHQTSAGPATPAELVSLVVTVTSMDAFCDRTLELGTRVRVTGPPTARDALRARLAPLAGAGRPAARLEMGRIA